MVALMLLLHVMFYSLYDARIVVLILTPPVNTTQELSGAQSASKKLEQRVKELEGIVADRDVCALCVCVCVCVCVRGILQASTHRT